MALELFSPALAADAEWVLAARLIGAAAVVEAERERLAKATGLDLGSRSRTERDRPSGAWLREVPSRVRSPSGSGVLFDGMDDALDLVREHFDEGLVSAGLGSGSIRWTGDVPAERLVALRRIAATREIPITLERAPWAVRQTVGSFRRLPRRRGAAGGPAARNVRSARHASRWRSRAAIRDPGSRHRSIPACTADSACRHAQPTRSPETRRTARAAGSCSCAHWSGTRFQRMIRRSCSTSIPASAAGAASRSVLLAWDTVADSRRPGSFLAAAKRYPAARAPAARHLR